MWWAPRIRSATVVYVYDCGYKGVGWCRWKPMTDYVNVLVGIKVFHVVCRSHLFHKFVIFFRARTLFLSLSVGGDDES